MTTTKAALEEKYNCPVYVRWSLVPANLHSRSWYQERFGVKIPRSAKPDAVKGGGQMFGRPRIYFLFKEEKWLDAETVRQLNIERRPKI